MDDDLTYRMPPDILHYEPRLIFGLSATELMIGAMVGMGGMLLLGVLAGLLLGLVTLVSLKRFDGLGGRSVIVWTFMLGLYKYKPQPVTLPRTLPPHTSRLIVQSWDGQTLFTMERKQ